jgi:hypothetical protein
MDRNAHNFLVMQGEEPLLVIIKQILDYRNLCSRVDDIAVGAVFHGVSDVMASESVHMLKNQISTWRSILICHAWPVIRWTHLV